jgi:hypothetical protein
MQSGVLLPDNCDNESRDEDLDETTALDESMQHAQSERSDDDPSSTDNDSG